MNDLPFTYDVPGNYLRVDRTNRNLSRTNFAKAIELMPADGPGQLTGRQGASYTWAILLVGARTRLTVDGLTVQVLSRRQQGAPWPANVNTPTVEGAHAVIFVDLVEQDVRTHHAAWLARVGGTGPRNPDKRPHSHSRRPDSATAPPM